MPNKKINFKNPLYENGEKVINSGNFDYMLTYSDTEKLIASDAPVIVTNLSTFVNSSIVISSI